MIALENNIHEVKVAAGAFFTGILCNLDSFRGKYSFLCAQHEIIAYTFYLPFLHKSYKNCGTQKSQNKY